MKRWINILLWLMVVVVASAQSRPQLLYDVDFCMHFDNHESNTPLQPSGTLFATRFTPAIGVGYQDSVVGSHRLMAGVSYIQPFGSVWKQAKVLPTVYYQFRMQGFRTSFGFVPYTMLYSPLPDFLMSDSMRFVYPNIQGALLQYDDARGEIELLCDWRGMMSDTVREAFRIIADGRGYVYRSKNHRAYLGGHAMLNHLSHSERVLGVCDDIVLHPMVGYRYDSGNRRVREWHARMDWGYLMSWQRDRVANLSHVSHGFRLDGELRWWFIGIREQLYVGGNSMMLYPRYRTLLNQGDPRYQAPVYSRTDFYLTLAQWQFLTLYAGWNVIWTKGDAVSNQQQVTCHFNVEQLVHYAESRRHHNK